MRLSSFAVWALSTAVIMAGCSSNTDDGGTGGSGNTPTPYTPTPNGKPMTEADACEAIVKGMNDALKKVSAAGACTLQVPQCPNFIQQSVPGNEACLMYDEGTVLGCVQYYGTFEKCADFTNRPCVIGYIQGSAPSGCPVQDAGADVEQDAPGAETSVEDATQPDDAEVPEDGEVKDDGGAPDDGGGTEQDAEQEDGGQTEEDAG